MVTITLDTDQSGCEFQIRPNCSITVRNAVLFYGAVAMLVIFVGIRFVLVGAWVVLPMATLEVLVLGVVVVMLMRRQRDHEIIRIRNDDVHIQALVDNETNDYFYPRHWAQVILERNVIDWYPSRLVIRSHGKETEIGSCLLEEDRRQLAEDLKRHLNNKLLN